ncbi:hypothetical protein ACUYOF_17115 [Photobacterium ganghwense]|uniref:hypothetical protein n=1 Tax=Photobacterium ganghwense TaxID=320778 RepID=UPI0040569DDF
MRKTHIALLVAVVASPLALANTYYDPYNPYGGYDSSDKTVSDSYNKSLDASLYVDVNKEYNIEKTYKSDNDTLKMYDVNNTYKKTWTDNSSHDYSQDWNINLEYNDVQAVSHLDGAVTYSEVTYGGACCDSGHGYGSYGGGYGGGYGSGSTLTVNHTNDMSGAFGGASGINIAGQNAGNNSLVQQSASTNAMLAGN